MESRVWKVATVTAPIALVASMVVVAQDDSSVLEAVAAATAQQSYDDALKSPLKVLEFKLPSGATGVAATVEPTADWLTSHDEYNTYRIPMENITHQGANVIIELDPRDLDERFIDGDGFVELSVNAANARRATWISGATAQAVIDTDGTMVWVDDASPTAKRLVGSEPVANRTHGGAGMLRAPGPVERAAELPVTDEFVQLSQGSDEATPDTAGAALAEADLKLTSVCDTWGKAVRTWDGVVATLGTTYPLGASKARLIYDAGKGTSNQTAVAVGWNVADPYGNAVGAGWKRSAMRRASGGFSATPPWGTAGTSRYYQADFTYKLFEHQVEVYSDFTDPYSGYTASWCEKRSTWRPIHANGGYVARDLNASRPNWDDCTTIPVDRGSTWTRYRSDGSDYTYSHAVKFEQKIGFNLKTERSYFRTSSESIVAEYSIRGTRDKKMCGNGRKPAVSGKQIERFW